MGDWWVAGGLVLLVSGWCWLVARLLGGFLVVGCWVLGGIGRELL